MQSDAKTPKRECGASRVLERVLDHIAEDEPVRDATVEDRCWAREQHAKMQRQIAAMRRLHTRPRPAITRAVAITPEIRALSREALVARLEAVTRAGAVRYANHELVGLTDEDLRQLLAVVTADPQK